jgi:hypothetical protein
MSVIEPLLTQLRYGVLAKSRERRVKPGMQFIALLLLLLFISGPLWAELAALQLDDSTLHSRIGGSDAIGGVGDWLLGNGTLCATISDIEHESGLSVTGGWLVDLGHCGRQDDQFTYTHLMPMMEREAMLPVTRIEALRQTDRATIVVYRANDSLEATIRYSMSSEDPEQLTIDTELRREGAGKKLSMVGQIWLHPHRVLTPFSISTLDHSYSAGYHYPAFERESATEALNAMMPADLTILVAGDASGPGISYGIQSLAGVLVAADGTERELMQLTLVETDYTNQLWLSRPLWFGGGGRPGRLEMLQSLFMDIEPGEILKLRQRILVSDRAEVASISNRVYQGHWLEGRLDTSDARIAVYDDENHPLTEARPAADGSFRLRLPRDISRCQLRLRTPWSEERRIDIELAGADLQLQPMVTAAPATVGLPRGETMRLVFVGQGITANPEFNSDMSDFRLGSKTLPVSPQSNSQSLVGDETDPLTLQLAAGRYRVYATRGPEYSVTSQDIEVASGESVRLALVAPQKVLDVPGWVSADFHVHSGYSFDSAISPQQRLRSFVAQGASVLVATEHDTIVDMAAVARSQGLDKRLTAISGAELTGMARTSQAPHTIGHVNVFPLRADAGAFAGGLPMHEGKRLHQVMTEVRRDYPEALIQLNHPRDIKAHDADMAFFEHLSQGEQFNPGLPLHNIQNRSLVEAGADGVRDIDFDALELANGASLELYQRVRADWLSLILQGEYRPALASSDSHHLRDTVAMPRSYLAYDGTVQHPIDVAAMVEAVRQGRVFGSSGPIPRVVLQNSEGEQAGIGEMVAGTELQLRLSVRAAPWVDVSQVWVYLNGTVVMGGPIAVGEEIELPLQVSEDSFVFVEFYGEPGEAYAAVAPGYSPMAFTNPVWIDADGDGVWRAPGLDRLPLAISRPTSLPNQQPDR